MTILCNDCKYFEDCPNLKENPDIIGCCDFGGFDEHGVLVQGNEVTNDIQRVMERDTIRNATKATD